MNSLSAMAWTWWPAPTPISIYQNSWPLQRPAGKAINIELSTTETYRDIVPRRIGAGWADSSP